MANHCIDLTCAACGRTWCAMCRNFSGPRPGAAKSAQRDWYSQKAVVSRNAECICGSGLVLVGEYYADNIHDVEIDNHPS